MKSFIQILGTGTGDMSPSCMYFYDQARFLINCGEGSQRFFTQHKLKLSRVNTIFLTQLKWDHLGGIPGLILTAADAGAPFVRIFGPRNTKHALASLRGFVQRSQFRVAVHEIHDKDTLSLTPMSVQAVELFPISASFSPLSFHPSSEQTLRDQELKKMFKTFDPLHPPKEDNLGRPASPTPDDEEYHPVGIDFDVRRLPKTVPVPSSLCYIFKGPDLPGKFYPQQARQLGVPVGPLYAKLVKGESITLPEDGRVIRPSDCMGPLRPGPVSLYLDIPSVDYLPSLFNTHGDSFLPLQQTPSVECIVHQLGSGVLKHPEYQAWMLRFGPLTKHIVLDADSCDQRLVFTSAALLQYHLHSIQPSIFPVPWHDGNEEEKVALQKELNERIILAEPLMMYHLVPNARLDVSACIPRTFDAKQPVIIEERDTRRIKLDPIDQQEMTPPACSRPDPLQVCFLGTGSALPSKYRNVSSIYLRALHSKEGKDVGVLLDCGEGSYGQMLRCFGPETSATLLRQLRIIYVSHLHADHHLGLVQILNARRKLKKVEPVTVIGPPRLKIFLEEYAQVCPLGLEEKSVVFVNSISRNSDDAIYKGHGLSVRTVPVIHTPSSYAIILESLHYRWKLV